MDVLEVVRRFIAAWNVSEAASRIEMLRSCCSPDAQFLSVEGIQSGPEALNDAISAFRTTFPRAEVVHGPVDAYGCSVRFRWETRWNDGREPLFGDDFVDLDDEGLILRVVSFNGSSRPPEPA